MNWFNSYVFFVTSALASMFPDQAFAQMSKTDAASELLRSGQWTVEYPLEGGRSIWVDPSSRTRVDNGQVRINVREPARDTNGPFAWRDKPLHLQVYTAQVDCINSKYKNVGWISKLTNRTRSVIGGGKYWSIGRDSILYVNACVDGYVGPPARSAALATQEAPRVYVEPQPHAPIPLATSPSQGFLPEELCRSYGFKVRTNEFSFCLMQLDQARQQALLAQQQYQLQLQQYQQQQAVYEAQQAAIKKERERRKWSALATLGFGMAASNSPTFGGGVADGLRALNGQPPLSAPVPPAPLPQDFTVRFSNGARANCSYDATFRDVRCW